MGNAGGDEGRTATADLQCTPEVRITTAEGAFCVDKDAEGGFGADKVAEGKDGGMSSSARDPAVGADWGLAPQFGSAAGSVLQRDGRSRHGAEGHGHGAKDHGAPGGKGG